MTVGDRLKALRTERNLSQRALAERAGIATNSVSLIERNETSPSVATLQNLATALQVRISYFFETDTEQRLLHARRGERSELISQGVGIQSIGSRIQNQELEPFVVRLEPHTRSGQEPVIHDGHELVYCLIGQFEYLIDDQVHLVAEGDFLVFEASLPHLWRNPFDTAAEFLLILQTPGSRLDPVRRHFVAYPSITHID